MISRELLIAEARTWLDTPWVHQGRLKGVGADCIALPVESPKPQGIYLEDRCNYPREPNGELQLELARQFDLLPSFEDAKPGDLLVFWFVTRGLPQHVGIKTEKGIIHTHQGIGRPQRGGRKAAGRVVETTLGDFWEPRKHSAWAYRGIEPWQL